MDKMVEPNVDSDEYEYVAKFLVDIYHKRMIPSNNEIKLPALTSAFRGYKKKNPCPKLGNNPNLVALLQRCKFIRYVKNRCNPIIVVINMYNFHNYYHDLIIRLDEAQKQGTSPKEIMTNQEMEFENKEPEIDPNSIEKDLKFEGTIELEVKNDFTLTSKGCFMCQKNFSLESDYVDHIEYHTEETEFECLNSENKRMIQLLEISYQMCKESSLLRFSIQNSSKDRLEICKIIVFTANSVNYFQDDKMPYTLSEGETSYFFVDCHTFVVGYEHPVVIVYKICSNPLSTVRYAEQHHFLEFEPFDVDIYRLINKNIPKHGAFLMKTKLKDYPIPQQVKTIFKSNDAEIPLLLETYPELKSFWDSKIIDENNVCTVFNLLLQIEDLAQRKQYFKLKQEKRMIHRSGEYYYNHVDGNFNLDDLLKPGDNVTISKPNDNSTDKRKKKFSAYVDRVLKNKVIFSFKDHNRPEFEGPYNIEFSPSRFQIILQFRALELLSSLNFMKTLLFPNPRMVNILPQTFDFEPYTKSLLNNPEQREAVWRITHEENNSIPYIIFGPPGTGKTTTIVESIYQVWKNDPKNNILVVGGSNACVDEIASRLIPIFADVDPQGRNLLRIYSSSYEAKNEHIKSDLLEISNLCHGYHIYPSIEIVSAYRIILMTLSIAGRYAQGGIASQGFTHAFVDECGASTEPEVLAALCGTTTRKAKLIIAGDPKQLGPILTSSVAEEFGLGVSMMDRLMKRDCYRVDPDTGFYDRSIQMRLIRNYRTHSDILTLANEMYYDGALKACAGPEITDWALNWHKLPSAQHPIIFHSVDGRSIRGNKSPSLFNWDEIRVVMNYIKELMYFGVNGRKLVENDIGIVSPYKKQCHYIKAELELRKWFEIEVGSVEKFQGQEKAVIILSTVRSNTDTLGFLVNPKRLNVSITRAQAALIIIGNADTLSKNSDWETVVEYCRKLEAFKIGRKRNLLGQSNASTSSLVSAISSASITNNKSHKSPNKKVNKAMNDNAHSSTSSLASSINDLSISSKESNNTPKNQAFKRNVNRLRNDQTNLRKQATVSTLNVRSTKSVISTPENELRTNPKEQVYKKTIIEAAKMNKVIPVMTVSPVVKNPCTNNEEMTFPKLTNDFRKEAYQGFSKTNTINSASGVSTFGTNVFTPAPSNSHVSLLRNNPQVVSSSPYNSSTCNENWNSASNSVRRDNVLPLSKNNPQVVSASPYNSSTYNENWNSASNSVRRDNVLPKPDQMKTTMQQANHTRLYPDLRSSEIWRSEERHMPDQNYKPTRNSQSSSKNKDKCCIL